MEKSGQSNWRDLSRRHFTLWGLGETTQAAIVFPAFAHRSMTWAEHAEISVKNTAHREPIA
jgi:hypothetical protein